MQSSITRRRFLGVATVTAAAVCLRPSAMFAEEENLVVSFRKAAGKAKINVTRIRGNLSMVEGAGGNITVLTGPDGKLLVEAGVPTAKAGLKKASTTLAISLSGT